MFSKFFINRPIFATVLALLIVVAGLVTLNILPVAQFPEITPPTVQVSAVYPGANAETVAQTVGIPIEQQVNGVDGMLYMSSNSSSSGAYSLTITFAVGTDIDMATVQVQNRVSIAQSSLPEPVVVQGVTVQKQSSNIVMFLTMTSQDSVYNSLYLTNYAKLNLVDQLTRVPGVGAVNVMGAGDYSMRIWLDPEAMRIRNISPQQVYQSIQSQNVEVSAGYIGQPIGQDNNNAFQYTLNVQGRLKSPEQFGNIIIRREQDGAMLRLKDIARIDLGSASYSVVSRLNGKPTAAIAIYQQPGSNSLDVSKGVKAKMEELAESIREHGVLIPGIVRPRAEGGYELIAVHRRKHGSELAGKTEMPVIIRDYSDDEATIMMVDSNIQRETILPSEKAKAYALKYEALKHQGKKSGKSTLDQVGEATGENSKKVQRYIWLSRLSDQLLQMVDEKRLGFSQGVDLSFLSKKSQQIVADAIEKSKCTVSMGQSAKLKEYEKKNELTTTVVRLILEEKNVHKRKVTLKMDKLSQYFDDRYSSEEMESIILHLLEEWKKTQEDIQ